MKFTRFRSITLSITAVLLIIAAHNATPCAAQDPAGGASTDRAKFYALMQQHDYNDAAQTGLAYSSAHPDDDAFALDVAYALLDAGRTKEGTQLLERLEQSSNAGVAKTARAQLAVTQAASSSVIPGYAYSYIENDSRFADTFAGISARYDLVRAQTVIPFADVHVSYDTRSGAPGVAQVYSDDYAALDLGIRIPVGTQGFLFAEGGESAGLRGQRNLPETRYGYAWSGGGGQLFAPSAHTDESVAIINYSRYAGNTIAFGSLTHDFKLANQLRGIGGINLNADTQRIYYNNYAEAYGGFMKRIGPTLSLRAVAVEGVYLNRGINPPATHNYSGYRIFLIFGQGFRL